MSDKIFWANLWGLVYIGGIMFRSYQREFLNKYSNNLNTVNLKISYKHGIFT